MKDKLKSPCNECPFRKNSLPGYLGGVWTAKELHQTVMGEAPFPCHQTMEHREEDYSHCVGSIMYMNKNAKRCQNIQLSRLQAKFKDEDHSNILSLVEFVEHHQKATKTKSTTPNPPSEQEVNDVINDYYGIIDEGGCPDEYSEGVVQTLEHHLGERKENPAEEMEESAEEYNRGVQNAQNWIKGTGSRPNIT